MWNGDDLVECERAGHPSGGPWESEAPKLRTGGQAFAIEVGVPRS
jgi:hypothetical protein